MDHYDVAVIGTGGGNKIALPAAARGLRTVLIEKDAFGGTCLNRGCIPSKMLIYPAELLTLLREARALNLTGTEGPGCDFGALVRRCSETVDAVSRENAARAAAQPNLTLLRGPARFTGPRTLEVDGRRLTADRIVIAAGSRPAPFDVAGADTVPYMTSREALRRETLPRRMIVIGAGYIGAELGFAYGAFGCDVQFIVRSRFLRHEDDDISAAFNAAFEARYGVHHGSPMAVSQAGGMIRVTCRDADEGTFEVEGDALLVATGIVPDTDGLDLDATAVTADARGFIQVDDRLRTTAEGIYAIGDCTGRHFFRHTVNYEGEYLMRTAFGNPPVDTPLDYGPVPHAVFTHPQVAGVGPTERELQQRGQPCIRGLATYADSTPGMARVPGHGLVKVLVDPGSRRLLAAHIIGEAASDMCHLFISAMVCKATLDQMLDMIFIHPALPEVARDALRAARDAAAGA